MIRLKLWLGIAGGLAVAFGAAMAKASRRTERKIDARANEARLENIEDGKERRDEIEKLNPDERARRFDGLW